MKRIRTQCLIDRPPDDVWGVLSDFGHYAEWNPRNVWASAEAKAGQRVQMRFVDAGGGKSKIVSQTVTVTACDPPRRLEWTGHIPLR